MLESERLHCLFVTRTDSAAGLDTVRFAQPKTFRLDRINRNLIAPLLDNITFAQSGDRPVVSHPERGWEQLKKRLLRDLERDGFILPAQLSVALQALRRLPALTVGEYERRGGSEGLERIHIERHTTESSRDSGLPADGVRRLLLSLVDPVRGKTVQLSTSQLVTLLGSGDEASWTALAQPLRRALDHLEERSIIRRRPAEGVDEDGWLLHHDYLCRGVLAADRRANRWQSLIRERARQYGQTSGALRRWKALLSPWEQVRFAAKRLTGALRYGEHRSFAIVSTLRFAPPALLFLGAWLASTLVDVRRDGYRADQIFAGISQDAQVHEMAVSSERVRWKVLKLAFKNEENAGKSLDRIPILIHGCLRLDPTGDLRKRYWRQIVRPALARSPSSKTLLLAATGWREGPGEKSDLPILVEGLMKDLEQEPRRDDYYDSGRILTALEAMASNLGPEQGRKLGDFFLKEWESKKTVSGIAHLSEGFKLTAAYLSPDQARRAADFVVRAAVEEESRLGHDWIDTIARLSVHLDRQTVLDLVEKFVNGLEARKRLGDRNCYHGLKRLLERVDPEDRRSVARQLEAAIGHTSKAIPLAGLMEALTLASEQADPHQQKRAVEKAIETMEHEEDAAALGALSLSLRDHAAIIDAAQGRRAVGVILQAMEKERNTERLLELGEGLRGFSAWLDQGEALRACRTHVKELEAGLGRKGSAGDTAVSDCLQSLAAFAAGLEQAQRRTVSEKVFSVLERYEDVWDLSLPVKTLMDLAQYLDKEEAQAHVARAVQEIEEETDRERISFLCAIARSCGMAEDPDQIRRARERVLQLMAEADGAFSVFVLAPLFDDLELRKSEELARQGADLIMKRLSVERHPPSTIHSATIARLARLADALAPEQIQSILSLLAAFSMKADDAWSLLGIWDAAEPLWRKAPDEDVRRWAEEAARRLAEVGSRGKMNPPDGPATVEFLRHAPDQALLNVLKEPFVIDSMREIGLKAFERKYGGSFENNLWLFVEWATWNPRTRNLDFR